MPTLGRRLQRARERKGWTQAYVCRKLSIPNSTMNGYEKDRREPPADVLSQLAELYEVSVDYLVGRGDIVTIIPSGSIRMIPVVAEISAGAPIFAVDNVVGHLPVDTSIVNLNGGDYAWVHVVGDSMINAGITNGSHVLIRLQPEVENGEIAAVCVDEESATLKRVFYGDGAIVLSPENNSMRPVSYTRDRVRVVGKAMKVLGDLL